MFAERSRRITAVGATLVVLVGCTSSEPDPPAATSGPSATPTDETSPTPPVREATTFSIGGFPGGIDLEPGTYRPHPGFDVQFTVDLGEGWRSIRDDAFGVISLVTGGTNSIGHATHWLSFFPAPPDVTTRDLLDRIDSQPKIMPGRPSEVTVGGISGTQVDARARPNPSEAGDDETEPGTVPVGVATDLIVGGFWSSETVGARFRFIVLDVGEQPLLVYLEAPSEDFNTFVADVEEALGALTFET